MGYAIGHIRIGARKVGVVGLENTLKEVGKLDLTEPKQIKTELLTRIRTSNYVPAEAETEYGEALYRAYRRSLGEDVPDEPGVLEIRVYGKA